MKKSTSLSAALMAAVTLSLNFGIAHAQSQLQRVAVIGPAAGDLSLPPLGDACPGYAQVLDDQLSWVAEQEGRESVVTVAFKLEGAEPIDLRVQGGGLKYRQAVRRAMNFINCVPGVAQGGAYKLLVSFNARTAQPHAALPAHVLAAHGSGR